MMRKQRALFLPRPAWRAGILTSISSFLCYCPSLEAVPLDTNNFPDPSSSLLPPRAELLPTFWEQNGAWVIAGSVLLLLGPAFVVWLVSRPRPVAPIPWAVQARRQLESFSQKPEDGMVLSRVSQVLRHCVAAAFGLSSDETTTAEFCRILAASDKVGPELAVELGNFLKECDRRKFAPAPPAAPFGAVGRCLKVIEMAEQRVAKLSTGGASVGNPVPVRSANEQVRDT